MLPWPNFTTCLSVNAYLFNLFHMLKHFECQSKDVGDDTNQIFFVSLMFDHNFVTRNIGSVHSDVQNVVSSSITIHLETVLTADKGLLETFAANLDL